jgi:Ras-related protein Rab-1A
VSTIGVDFKIKTLTQDGKVVKLQIWDTAGQERFRSITKSYYAGSHGVAIVFDLANRETFDKIGFWMKEIEGAAVGTIPCKILIGNKCDRTDRQVSTDEGQEAAQRLGIPYLETSAKDAVNVAAMFGTMTKVMIEASHSMATELPKDAIRLDKGQGVKVENKKGCC